MPEKQQPIDSHAIVNLLSVSEYPMEMNETKVNSLARGGYIKKISTQKYGLVATIKGYVRHLLDRTNPKRYVSASDLAMWLGISTRHLAKLKADGMFTKTDGGRYHLWQSIQDVMTHWKEKSTIGGKSLTDERTRETRLRADILEVEYSKIQGALVDISLALEVWQGVMGAFRSKIASATVRMRPIIQNIKTDDDKKEAQTFLKQLHNEALDELSGIEIADYTSDQEIPDDSEAAAEHDDKPVGGRKKAVKPGRDKRVRKVANKKS